MVDPVMVSTSGDVLAGPSVLAGFRYDNLLCITLSKLIVLSCGCACFMQTYWGLFGRVLGCNHLLFVRKKKIRV